MSKKVITRFAPSPTGRMHIGNLRIAIINFLFAKKNKGNFILRIDDTDSERNVVSAIENIKEDLHWIGIKIDKVFKQSEQTDIYADYIRYLKDKGLIYPCYETIEELEQSRQERLKNNLPPIYNRKSLTLSKKDILKYEKEGKKPHYRFYLGDNSKNIDIEDDIRGHINFQISNLSDPVVLKEDGNITYLLSSVIDDIVNEVTHILRGEDHISNTPLQQIMFQALNADLPHFAHFSLISYAGKKFSKRDESISLEYIRNNFIPFAVMNFLSHMGTKNNLDTKDNIADLASIIELSNYSVMPTKYHEEDLNYVNSCIIKKMNLQEVQIALNNAGINLNINSEFLEAIKNNIANFNDIISWYDLIYYYQNKRNNYSLDLGFLKVALELLPKNDQIDKNTWLEWTKKISNKTGKKGKELFLPLRLALTGLDHGPAMKDILSIIGYKQIVKRLESHFHNS